MTTPGSVAPETVGAAVRSARVLGLGELGQAEVEDLDEAVLRDHEVLGLQVAVHDPGAVRFREAVGGLRGDAEERSRRQGAVGQNLAQRSSLDELHRDELDAVRGADVVDRDEIRVVQRRGRARFLLEALQPLGVRREGRRENLESELPTETRVARAIDLPHPARSERSHDFVGSESRAGCKRHEVAGFYRQRPTLDGRVKPADESGRAPNAGATRKELGILGLA